MPRAYHKPTLIPGAGHWLHAVLSLQQALCSTAHLHSPPFLLLTPGLSVCPPGAHQGCVFSWEVAPHPAKKGPLHPGQRAVLSPVPAPLLETLSVSSIAKWGHKKCLQRVPGEGYSGRVTQ